MKKKKSVAGRIIGGIGILLAAALIFGAVYILTAGSRADRSGAVFGDPTAVNFIPESTGTAAHLSFTDEAEMSILFDEGDLLYFFNGFAGNDWAGSLQKIIAPFGLEMTGAGLDVSPDGLTMLAELRRGTLIVPVEALCRVEYESGEIRLSPEKLTVSGIKLDPVKLAGRFGYDISGLCWTYTPKTLFLAKIDRLELQDGFVKISGKLETDYLRDTTVDEGRSLVMRFSQRTSCYAGAVLNESTSDNPKICFAPILDKLQETPEFFTTFLSQLFRVLTPGTESLSEMNYGMIYRWFPELQSSYSAERTEENSTFQMHVHALSSLTDYVLERYCGRRLRIQNGEFLFNKEGFNAESFYTDNYITYRNLYTDIDNSRFCLCLLQKEGRRGMPKLSEICDSVESISGEADKSLRYAPGILLRGADGSGYVLAFSDDGCQITPLEENVFLELLNAPKVPLFDMTE